MNELIKIHENKTVSARELHEFLEIKTKFSMWFSRMKEYGFSENIDYARVSQKCATLGGVQEVVDYAISINMAKEISMIQRNEKGREARKYFIACENKLKEIANNTLMLTDNEIMAKALQISQRTLEERNLRIKELEPKAKYTDVVLSSPSLLTVTQIANDYGMTAYKFNQLLHELKLQYKQGEQWFLYAPYKDKGYAFSETTIISKNLGITRTNMTTKWTQKGRKFLYDLLKVKGIVPTIERRELA